MELKKQSRKKRVDRTHIVYAQIRGGFPEAMAALAKERKRLEAKAKRDAKKAAANGAQ